MAEPSRRGTSALLQSHAVSPAQEMEVGKGETKSSAAISQFQTSATSETFAGDTDVAMSAEELEDDDLLDDEEEYQKEVAMQRCEDEKNGHFRQKTHFQNRSSEAAVLPGPVREVDDEEFQKDMDMQRVEDMRNGHFRGEDRPSHESPKLLVFPGMLPVDDDNDRLHSLEEIRLTTDQFCGRLEELHASPHLSHAKRVPSPSSAQLIQPTGSSPSVHQTVQLYESILPLPPTDKEPPHSTQQLASYQVKPTSLTPTSHHRLQINKKKEKKRHGVVQRGKAHVLHAIFDGMGHPKNLESGGDAFIEDIDMAEKATHPKPSTMIPATALHGVEGMKGISDVGDHSFQSKDLLPMKDPLPSAATEPDTHHLTTPDHPFPSRQIPCPAAQNDAAAAAALGSSLVVQVIPSSPLVNDSSTSAITAQPNHIQQPKSSQQTNAAQPKHLNNSHAPPSPAQSPLAQTAPHHCHAHPQPAPHPQSLNPQTSTIPHSHATKKKNNIKAVKHSSETKAITAALFCGASNSPNNGMDNVVNQSVVVDEFIDEEMEEFPPLQPKSQLKTNEDGRDSREASANVSANQPVFQGCAQQHVGINGKNLEAHLHDGQASLSPPPSLDPCRIMWAKLMEKNVPSGEAVDHAQQQPRDASDGGQRGDRTAQSMADTLRAKQQPTAPIFLDKDKAEKRGEVRIVEGKPCLFFSANETSILAGRLGPAIIGKFSHSIPPAHQIQKALGKIKLSGEMTWNFLNAKHIFIQLTDMRDYVKLLNGPNNSPVWYIEHHPMRVFKWTPDFDPFFESPITTIWCNILALPVHLFEESSLIAIGEMLGTPVQVDRATISRTRVSFARICVEVDLSRPIVEEIDINIAGKQVTLKVKWDKIPLYCLECKHVGHSAATCYAAGKRPMPPKRDYSHGAPFPQSRVPTFADGQPRPHQPRQQLPPPVAPPARKGHQTTPRHQDLETTRQERPAQDHHPRLRQMECPPAASAAEGSQAEQEDGFTVVVKKKKPKNDAARKRERARRRRKKQERPTTLRTASDGGGDQSSEGDQSSSNSDKGSRSLSPSHRSRPRIGPLAMVVHNDNMFGALEDDLSDDCGVPDEPQDISMEEANIRQLCLARPLLHLSGPGSTSSPPQGGTPKRARRTASTSH